MNETMEDAPNIGGSRTGCGSAVGATYTNPPLYNVTTTQGLIISA